MASTSTRNYDTSTSSLDGISAFPIPPTNAAINMTPERTPEKKVVGITQAQKQALIDNLQLEITERARRLRAQYATQAAQLRSRLELRVNRIPQALRKRKLQDLMDEHTARSKPAPPPAMPAAAAKVLPTASARTALKPKQGLKRKSDQMAAGDDKENLPSQSTDELPNPKKRTRAAPAAANSKASRTASRKAGPTTVLSPKSHNSRTLTRSPLKQAGGSQEKLQVSRPLSAASRAKPKVERAPSRQVKRPDAATETEGRSSGASNTSAGTTIIKRPGAKKATVAKKAAPVKTAPVTKKPAAATAKKEAAAPTATAGGRTLRKRN